MNLGILKSYEADIPSWKMRFSLSSFMEYQGLQGRKSPLTRDGYKIPRHIFKGLVEKVYANKMKLFLVESRSRRNGKDTFY